MRNTDNRHSNPATFTDSGPAYLPDPPATHGILAGQLQGLGEPALVLTIPEHPTEEDDGLLTMGEILDFQLPNVDWVILSACNTGGDDGNGQGLTGLARLFFYACAKTRAEGIPP